MSTCGWVRGQALFCSYEDYPQHLLLGALMADQGCSLTDSCCLQMDHCFDSGGCWCLSFAYLLSAAFPPFFLCSVSQGLGPTNCISQTPSHRLGAGKGRHWQPLWWGSQEAGIAQVTSEGDRGSVCSGRGCGLAQLLLGSCGSNSSLSECFGITRSCVPLGSSSPGSGALPCSLLSLGSIRLHAPPVLRQPCFQFLRGTPSV